MRRIVIGAAVTLVAVMVGRALVPKLRTRMQLACERMFEEMPDDFPPKRMLLGIEEIRANTARTVELLDARRQTETEPVTETRLHTRASAA